jgi:hypothetical protein
MKVHTKKLKEKKTKKKKEIKRKKGKQVYTYTCIYNMYVKFNKTYKLFLRKDQCKVFTICI